MSYRDILWGNDAVTLHVGDVHLRVGVARVLDAEVRVEAGSGGAFREVEGLNWIPADLVVPTLREPYSAVGPGCDAYRVAAVTVIAGDVVLIDCSRGRDTADFVAIEFREP